MRGVQLFDMLLTEQMLGLDLGLTLPVEATWDRRLRERMDLGGGPLVRFGSCGSCILSLCPKPTLRAMMPDQSETSEYRNVD